MSQKILLNFFDKLVDDAVCDRNIKISFLASEYLKRLLIKLIRVEYFFEIEKFNTLFDIYNEAISAKNKYEAINKYQYLGDYALVIIGYFPSSLNNKIINGNYYLEMGSSAYSAIYNINKTKVYKDLAYSYKDCAEVLTEISEYGKKYNIDDIPDLYNTWTKTDSKVIRDKLIRLGLVLNNEFDRN